MKLKSGHEVIPITKEEEKKLEKYFPYYKNGAVKLQPGGWFFMTSFLKYADKIYDFKYKPSDVVIMTWPKCGTTWTQEIVWTMMHNPDFMNEAAALPTIFRSPFLEFDFIPDNCNGVKPDHYKLEASMKELFNKLCPGKNMEDSGIMLEVAQSTKEPRIIKTHLAFSLLHPEMLDTCKVVYVARNAKDVCISYLHHHRLIEILKYEGDLDNFIDFYVNDSLMYSPYWEHVKEGWERRNHKNIHWIFYEEMKKNPRNEIKRLNNFLGTNLTEDILEKIAYHTTFSNMKKRDPMFSFFDTDDGNMIYNVAYQREKGNFFRKGKQGDWNNHLNSEQNEKLEKWITEKSAELGIPFTY